MLPYQNLSLEDMPGEEWRDIPGWEGYYQISNLGRVKSVSHTNFQGKTFKTRILRQTIGTKGYFRVRLYDKGKQCGFHVARLVALAFIGNPDGKPTIDHINGDKSDNRVENLKWATHHENQMNPILRKRRSEIMRSEERVLINKNTRRLRGAENRRSRAIVGISQNGTPVFFSYIGQVAQLGFDPSNVSSVCRKVLKSTGGWVFYYEDDPALRAFLPKK